MTAIGRSEVIEACKAIVILGRGMEAEKGGYAVIRDKNFYYAPESQVPIERDSFWASARQLDHASMIDH
ncbi:uncharacterized protein BO66DRAFT_471078 [Aspergillus aculeatinus CBS 121060]|uniref:Uncharacterized protein n=1 Tax=Aspergillus aculeatinus CBS 121060 TaxID=1448322 RepID=A0ACD1HBJ9_9EURO|nr:hypothetical protein BO66DRAFT_471078 [Aspergillus aculeatinus CBS 121060]RAH70750.1 hypothetical protein BO66DRAFT_471078 [Aspergillus aculeatinus CBS 121060]